MIPAAATLACSKEEKAPVSKEINLGWKLQSGEIVKEPGEVISTTSYKALDWYNIEIPATVIAALRQNGEYADIFYADNIEKIDQSRFECPWWYRKVFTLDKKEADDIIRLRFEGLNYQANIWVNGNLLRDTTEIEGPFSRWAINVTPYVKTGDNVVAVEIVPPVFGDLTIGFVDWNPAAPDGNMGLWRGVELIQSKAVTVESPMVATRFVNGKLNTAELTVRALVNNHSAKSQKTVLKAELEEIGTIEKTVHLEPGEEKDVIFEITSYPELKVANPKIWWPNNLGEPYLHNIHVQVEVAGKPSHRVSSRFGIREIEQYLNEEGHKGWKVNGKKLIIKGAGWVDDMLLADSDEKVAAQMDYVKHMNLNCIRLEGFWGKNKTIYDTADERGLLIMVGWSCHWEWQAYCGRPENHFMAITGEKEIERHAQSYRDQVLYMRNHPSVFLYVFGSDKLPLPELERKLEKYIGSVDNSRPLLSSCKYWNYGTDHYNNSEVSGPSAVKMLGPYSYVPPVYWYIADNAGGAYGFNTETGPGPQVPPVESLKKMIPEDKLWPINDMWNFHCGRHEFGSLDRFLKSFNPRYGEAKTLEEFTEKAQISNYEAMRPMFEAFQLNRYKATGVIQWMLNSAWPEMFWQLYDYYLVPNGAFYGAKKACQPLNVIYNYKDKDIYFVNDFHNEIKDLTVKVKVLDINSKVVFEKETTLNAKPNSSKKVIELPELKEISTTYFVDLRVLNNEKEIANNFYWLSTKADELDFSKTFWVGTPPIAFADLTGINTMPKAKVEAKWSEIIEEGKKTFTCKLKNNSGHIAFFTETAIVDKNTGEIIVPVFWSDNYTSLLPGEERTVTAQINMNLLEGKQLGFRVKGWNH